MVQSSRPVDRNITLISTQARRTLWGHFMSENCNPNIGVSLPIEPPAAIEQ